MGVKVIVFTSSVVDLGCKGYRVHIKCGRFWVHIKCGRSCKGYRVHIKCGSSPDRVKSKTIKLTYVTPPVSTQHSRERAKTGWLGIGIMCSSGVIYVSADCCFSVL